MTFSVGDVSDQTHILVFRSSQKPVCGPYQDLDNVDVLPFVEAADIVCLRILSFVENQVDGSGMVLDIKPVTDILPFSVDRKRLPVTDIVDEKRYQLFSLDAFDAEYGLCGLYLVVSQKNVSP